MGVDATLFVLGHSGSGVGFVEHVLGLERDSDLWTALEEVVGAHKHRRWPQLQLPRGSWVNYSGDVPEGYEDHESGYLQSDSYDGDFWAFKGKHLAGVCRVSDGDYPEWRSELNEAVLAFVSTHCAECDVVVFWH